jgi:hypothetical protein
VSLEFGNDLSDYQFWPIAGDELSLAGSPKVLRGTPEANGRAREHGRKNRYQDGRDSHDKFVWIVADERSKFFQILAHLSDVFLHVVRLIC